MQFLRARYYDPGTGRFLSHDSFPGYLDQSQSQNAYAYGLENPVLYRDPSGNFVFPWNKSYTGPVIGLGGEFSNVLMDKATGAVDKALGAAENMINGNCINWGQLLMDGGAEAISEIIGMNEAINSWIINSYEQGWTNFLSATSVVQNPNASPLFKAYAWLYIGAWGGAHLAFASGGLVVRQT